MNPLIFDAEATGAQRNKGNPFDPRNRLCTIQSRFLGNTVVRDIQYGEEPYQHKLDEFQGLVDSCDIVVGFNLKYDIHWGRRYGLRFHHKRVWDCQLYHFLQSNQRHRFPSMDDVAIHHGIPVKKDIVKTEYWEKGLDTDQVPWDILEEYAAWDVDPVNEQIYLRQMEEFQTLPENRRKLILLQMKDLLVLEDMEFNGVKYNVDLSLRMGNDLDRQIKDIDARLSRYLPLDRGHIPISFNSDEHVSAFLYGGVIRVKERESYTFHYKDGKKPPVEKERWHVVEYQLPKIFDPLERTEKKKEGIFSVDKTTITKLRNKASGFAAFICDQLLLRSSLEKQMSTYCFGTPKLMAEMNWEGNFLHGQLNQSVVVTGRLSCSKPNLQNQQDAMQVCFESRYRFRNKTSKMTAKQDGIN